MGRFAVRIGSAALAALCLLLPGAPARADSGTSFVFESTRIDFTHVVRKNGNVAIGADDPGFRTLLGALGANLTWKPGDRSVLIATAQPVIISFTVGETRYDVGTKALTASFAPFEQDAVPYVPLQELLGALDLAIVNDGGTRLLQPQLTDLDLSSSGGRTTLVARAAIALHARVVADDARQLTLAFDGVGSTLAGTKPVQAAGVSSLVVSVAGVPRAPTTLISLQLTPGAAHGVADTDDGRDFKIGLSGPMPLGGGPATTVAVTTPSPSPQPLASATPALQASASPAAIALVSAVAAQSDPAGVRIAVTVSGGASFEWHRLRDPDNRFWIDLHGAQLSMPPRDDALGDPVQTVRIRQLDPTTVRVALSLTGEKLVNVLPTATGIELDVATVDAPADAARIGTGSIGGAIPVVAEATPNPLDTSNWKFGPQAYVPANPRLIVIDPGHGGSDRGAIRNGVSEAALALDMANRLQAILVARGWEVTMTHTDDSDVYAPNDTARQELQARDDIANNAGARLLVSVHVNSFINAGPNGTTTYYAKPSDVALADAIRQRLAAGLATKDDGVVKSKFYIVLHALMPAALVETAFLSNPDDFAKLNSPQWRQHVAQAIADGIGDYAGAPPPAPNQ